MKIYAVNASPRKKWNTATLLQHALDGAVTEGGSDTQAQIIHLYDYTYTGCKSCFHCKRLGGKYYGRCGARDELTPILEKLSEADVIIFGSPIYFGDATGMLRSLEERLLYPYLVYAKEHPSLAPKTIQTGFIYTMNVTEDVMNDWGYPERLRIMEGYVGRIFGHTPYTLYVNNTYQFSDYSRYKCDLFSVEDKQRHRETYFGQDCQHAQNLGAQCVKAYRAANISSNANPIA